MTTILPYYQDAILTRLVETGVCAALYSEEGGHHTEITGEGYVRLDVQPVVDDGVLTNTTTLTWSPESTWPVVTHLGLCELGEGGALLLLAPLDTAWAPSPGQNVSIPAGDLRVGFA